MPFTFYTVFAIVLIERNPVSAKLQSAASRKSKGAAKFMRKKRMILILLSAAVIGGTALFAFQSRKSPVDSTGYKPNLANEYLVTQYPDATGQQGTFYTIEKEGALVVVDGGWADNADAVREVIRQHGNVVDAWIISHPHKDHAGAFNVIYADLQDITVRELYDNSYDYDFIESVGEPYDDITVMEEFYRLTKDADNLTHLKRGDKLKVCGLDLEVFNAYDDNVLSHVGSEKDYQNNASLLFKLSSENSSILFCSDIKYDMSDYLLESAGSRLASDYVQTGHHGNWSFYDTFYDRADASVYFIDAPTGITDNPDFPASSLKQELAEKGRTVLDFGTAPNTVTLK